MLVCFFCTLCEFIENCMGKSSGENSNTHTHKHTQHTCTHTRRIPLNEAASSASALHLLCPPVSSPRSAFIKPSTHSHTLTHIAHRVHSKKKWLPSFATPAAPPFKAHYTLGLSCLKIDKLILKLYKQRLSSLSLCPSLSLSLSLLTFIFYAPILPSLLPIPPTTD